MIAFMLQLIELWGLKQSFKAFHPPAITPLMLFVEINPSSAIPR